MHNKDKNRKIQILSYYNQYFNMADQIQITRGTYIRIAEIIFQRNYNENNLMKLISNIFFMMKIDNNHRNITVTYIKSRVNDRIKQKIRDYDNIYDILHELIHIINNYRRSQNRRRN